MISGQLLIGGPWTEVQQSRLLNLVAVGLRRGCHVVVTVEFVEPLRLTDLGDVRFEALSEPVSNDEVTSRLPAWVAQTRGIGEGRANHGAEIIPFAEARVHRQSHLPHGQSRRSS